MSFICTLIQSVPTLCIDKNIALIKDKLLKYNSSDLIIFPELALNGYQMMDAFFEYALSIDQIEKIFADCKQHMIISCALREGHKIFNSAIYLANGNIKHIHRKKHLPNYTMFEEARYFFTGSDVQPFDINYGNNKYLKTAILICEEVWVADNYTKLSALHTDMIIVISASPARGFEQDLQIKQQWQALLQSLAILCKSTVIFVNRVGFEDGIGFFGGSMVINNDGIIVEQAELFKQQDIHFDIADIDMKWQPYLKRHEH